MAIGERQGEAMNEAAFQAIERLIDNESGVSNPACIADARTGLANARRLLEAAEAHYACPSDDDAWDKFEAAILACRAETKNHAA